MYVTNQLLFQPQVIPHLADVRGPAWQELVERVKVLPEDHPESLAFQLTMIRLDGCMECETDSYRAMRGCQACAQQTLRRFKRTDEELLSRYCNALNEVNAFLEKETARRAAT